MVELECELENCKFNKLKRCMQSNPHIILHFGGKFFCWHHSLSLEARGKLEQSIINDINNDKLLPQSTPVKTFSKVEVDGLWNKQEIERFKEIIENTSIEFDLSDEVFVPRIGLDPSSQTSRGKKTFNEIKNRNLDPGSLMDHKHSH